MSQRIKSILAALVLGVTAGGVTIRTLARRASSAVIVGMDGLKDLITFALVPFRSLDLTNLHALGQFWYLYTSSGAVLIAQNETDTSPSHCSPPPARSPL